MNDSLRDILSLFLLKSFFLSCCFCHILKQLSVVGCQLPAHQKDTDNRQLATDNYFLPGAFFLATAALRGPFLVRAFVLVRCPRTGRPRR